MAQKRGRRRSGTRKTAPLSAGMGKGMLTKDTLFLTHTQTHKRSASLWVAYFLDAPAAVKVWKGLKYTMTSWGSTEKWHSCLVAIMEIRLRQEHPKMIANYIKYHTIMLSTQANTILNPSQVYTTVTFTAFIFHSATIMRLIMNMKHVWKHMFWEEAE